MMNPEQYFRVDDWGPGHALRPSEDFAQLKRPLTYSIERLPSGCLLYRLTFRGISAPVRACIARARHGVRPKDAMLQPMRNQE
jgi:hypothetical protein